MYTTMYELILALMEEIRVQTTDSSLIMFSTANDKVREVYSNSRLQWNVTMSNEVTAGIRYIDLVCWPKINTGRESL